MEAQREETEGQKKQFEFEIYVLVARVCALELERERLTQKQTCTSRFESVELPPERKSSQTVPNVEKLAGAPCSTQDTTKTPV